MNLSIQKQPFRGVLKKKRFENMQQIYWRSPTPKQIYTATLLKPHFGMGILL